LRYAGIVTVGPGAEKIECVAFRFSSDCLLEDLREIVERCAAAVFVNDREVARSLLYFMPMIPPMSSRFVFSVNYRVKEGDRVRAELIDTSEPGYMAKGPVTIHAELSILGRLPSAQLARWIGSGVDDWYCEIVAEETPPMVQ